MEREREGGEGGRLGVARMRRGGYPQTAGEGNLRIPRGSGTGQIWPNPARAGRIHRQLVKTF